MSGEVLLGGWWRSDVSFSIESGEYRAGDSCLLTGRYVHAISLDQSCVETQSERRYNINMTYSRELHMYTCTYSSAIQYR